MTLVGFYHNGLIEVICHSALSLCIYLTIPFNTLTPVPLKQGCSRKGLKQKMQDMPADKKKKISKKHVK